MIISGIDEAGRGPVLGPMVISVFSIEEKREVELLFFGVKDSKKLSRQKREKIFEKFLNDDFDFKFFIINPEEIDEKSLNKIFIEKVLFFAKRIEAKRIYLDAPCHRSKCKELSFHLSNLTGKEIVALNKADELIPVVSASSIISKVIRDREIDKLHKIYGDFGSGYPSDKKTIKWLAENKDLAIKNKILRKKWRLKNFDFILKNEGSL